MNEFFAIALGLPAAPFALALVTSVVYWIVVTVTGLDFDGHADASVDAAADAVGDAVADAVADAAAHALGDAAAHATADAVADAAAHAVGHGDLEGAGDTLHALSGPSRLLGWLRLGKVPLTFWVSLFSFWGWLVSFGIGWALRHPLEGAVPAWLGAIGGTLAATVAGALLAGLTARPLEPLFRAHHGRVRDSLQGETAEVTTSRVDRRFGQARVQVGGDDLLVQVRNDRSTNGLVRGGRVLLVGFDARRDAWIVEPMSEATPPGARRPLSSAHRAGEG